VLFVGRLATYKYYNMDQVVGQALAVYARLMGQKRSEATRASLVSVSAGARTVRRPDVASPAKAKGTGFPVPSVS
jgi:hypothetical protein